MTITETRAVDAVEYFAAVDELAEELLDEAEADSPPIDAFSLAARLGIEVIVDGGQAVRGRFKNVAGRPSIFLRPEPRPERLQWAAAHEIGEAVAWRVSCRVGWEVDPAGQLRERIANALAARLLLPHSTFERDAYRFNGDLFALRRIYTTASHELIACRLLDLPEPSIVTVFDHGRITRRQCNGGFRPPRPIGIELNCRTDAHRNGTPVEVYEDGLTVCAWPIHEPGWKREIVRTTAASDFNDCWPS